MHKNAHFLFREDLLMFQIRFNRHLAAVIICASLSVSPWSLHLSPSVYFHVLVVSQTAACHGPQSIPSSWQIKAATVNWRPATRVCGPHRVKTPHFRRVEEVADSGSMQRRGDCDPFHHAKPSVGASAASVDLRRDAGMGAADWLSVAALSIVNG